MPSPTLTPQDFVFRWRGSTLTERSACQQHFIDLCALVGHPTPAQVDQTGENYTFEAGVAKTKGGKGWADVWKRGVFGWEYKGKHKDLTKAYEQLLDYREALENPPLMVVSDMDRIVVHTNFTNTKKKEITIGLDDLKTPAGMQQLRAIFNDPEFFREVRTSEDVTAEAAQQFGAIAERLRNVGTDPHEAAHYLIRLLFCLFAEDIGLLPKDLFTKLVNVTKDDPNLFSEQLSALFKTMATGGMYSLEKILWFNGGLFDDAAVVPVDRESMEILAKICRLDWSHIEPSILGVLFERSLDPAKRAQLGAHYTGKEDILLIVEPVLMAPLRRQWEEIRRQADELVVRRDSEETKGKKDNRQKELRELLTRFAYELSKVRVLDPACGSGNFLYVALRQLLDLEKEVIDYAGSVGVGTFFPSVSPAQLYGIEINEYAHELAQATIQIGYIQWLNDNGFGRPEQPILKRMDNIRRMDAILTYDDDGHPSATVWPSVDVIIGNPPFLGGKKLRSELGNDVVDDLFAVYKGRVPHECDLVTYWFERSRAQIHGGEAKRTGLIATQSIRAGANRKILDRIRETGSIFLAWRDRPWTLDGAAVRVSVVSFDDGSEPVKQVDGKIVETIHSDLTSEADLTTAQILSENTRLSFMGDTKGGAFDIPSSLAAEMLTAPRNPNGRTNSDVVRPWANGNEVTGRPRGTWIIDFGTLPEDEAALYEIPFEYVSTNVRPERMKNNRAVYRNRWWIHVEARPAMRAALAQLQRYIATPRVAKHRLFVWLHGNTLPDSRLYCFARDDDYFFGVLHSQLHEVWSLATSSRHGVGNDPTYNNTTCFETFPFPWPPGTEPIDDPRVEAIAAAARELIEKRDRWLNPKGASESELKKRTLTNLYNQRPTWLDLAHKKLDNAVFDAYGWPHDLTDEQILERLLALNQERATTSTATGDSKE